MAGETPRELAAEFRLSRQLNWRVKKAVYHASLSLPKTEYLEDGDWLAIAHCYPANHAMPAEILWGCWLNDRPPCSKSPV
ncbi:MAG: relaxase/mobilization nuclease domain-containing protein [Elainellaceae cyanobacterium]